VGSTRHWLLTSNSAVASESLAAAPSAPRYSASAAVASPTSGDSAPDQNTPRSSHVRRLSSVSRRANSLPISAVESLHIALSESASSTSRCTMRHAAHSIHSLLLPCTGRHAHDEPANLAASRSHAFGQLRVRAVKNLRIVGSAVLLLNFREVSDFHFCSIGVAM
jgi:hypothetical protein